MQALTTQMRVQRYAIGSLVSLFKKVLSSLLSSSEQNGLKSSEGIAAKMALQAKLTMWGKHLCYSN